MILLLKDVVKIPFDEIRLNAEAIEKKLLIGNYFVIVSVCSKY